MRLSLHEVLAIVGRLDDTPGYDTPRERFRRFLIEHMTSVPVARTFLDEAQQLLSEQYQRALQDAVLVAGRLLGFETTFGRYERQGAAARDAGQWISRRRLAVTVLVWCDGASTDATAVARSLDAQLAQVDPGTPHTRLCVISPSCGSRSRIEEAIGLRSQATRVVSLRSLMDLASLAGTSSVTHDDVLRLLNPSPSIEGTIGLLARLVHPSRPVVQTADAPTMTRDAACWMYVIREHEPGSLQPAGVGEALQMTMPEGETPPMAPPDLIGFLVPSRGVVAQARIAAVVGDEDGAGIDGRTRYSVRLRDVVILSPPTIVDTEQRLNLELQAAVSQEPCVRVTRSEFEALTLSAPDSPSAAAADLAVES